MRQGINTDEVGGAGCFAPVATVAAFEKGGQWLKELCEYIAENKRVLSEFLEKELPMVHLAEGHATYLCWLDCRNVSQDDVNLQKFLRKEAKLFVSAGSSYGSSGRGFLRINLACPRSLVLEGLKRLKNGILAYNKQAKDK